MARLVPAAAAVAIQRAAEGALVPSARAAAASIKDVTAGTGKRSSNMGNDALFDMC